MRGIDFPIFRTRVSGVTRRFNLNDPHERKGYFEAKAGAEIKKLRAYLAKHTFLAFLIGKKNSGKGTYSKLFMEAVGGDRVGHVSVGDIVRDVHRAIQTGEGKKELMDSLNRNYRGFHSLQEIEDIIVGRDTQSLISSELVMALLQYEIAKRPRQAIFIDGFPRTPDQINYSLFLKQTLGYRDDPDFLVFLSVPETVIDARIKARVVCPLCKTPRSLKLAPTREIGYDKKTREFYLICDNPECKGARMVAKEGDELGIEPIRDRLEVDDKIFRELLKLKGLPHVKLRNALPADRAWDYVEQYEVTPMYSYKRDASGKIEVVEEPWVISDDDGVASVSLLPAPVALAFLKQTAEVLGL